MPLLFDLEPLDHCCATDHALEGIYKALSGEDGFVPDIFSLHENTFIQQMVELFHARGLTRLQSIQDELNVWLMGQHYKHHPKAKLPPGTMGRWTPSQLGLVKLYLENIPPNNLTLDDWSVLIDYLVQRYLPYDELVEEAEWLATKAAMMGKVQAHVQNVSAAQAMGIVTALPPTLKEADRMFKLSDATRFIIGYGKRFAGENIVSLSEGVRHTLKGLVLDYQFRKLNGDMTAAVGALQTKLREKFGDMNRDWRRIAVTEIGEMQSQGVIASLPVGTKVRRMEMYKGACPFCRKLDGRVFNVVDPSDPKKDGEKDVWVGKTNIGRSASPRKRTPTGLQDREPHEKWWAAAGVQHPHCRGHWAPLAPAEPGDDPDFAEWLNKKFGVQVA